MKRQLTFDLPPVPALGRADFFVSESNRAALALLDGWRDWPGGQLALTGPEGAGKSHLAAIWVAETRAAALAAQDLAGADIPALAAAGHVLVEDADRAAGDAGFETALFHLANLVRAQGGRLLVTARQAPAAWPCVLPDLASRMQAMPLALLGAPDDGLLSAVLVKLFADRQLAVAPAVVAYLVARMDRSLAAARELVAALDARALAEGRAVTRALAAEILGSRDRGEAPVALDSAGAADA